MKFTDGNWMMRRGVRAYYPAQAYEVAAAQNALTVQAPAKAIRHRGDTLDGPLLTVRCSSPVTDVVRIGITHFAGGPAGDERLPQFQLSAGHTETSVHLDEEQAVLTSGRLSVRIARTGGWDLSFLAGGRTLTRSGPRGIGLAEVEGEGQYLHEQLRLGVGECVYGLGERFTAFVKNGQVVETWNKDG